MKPVHSPWAHAAQESAASGTRSARLASYLAGTLSDAEKSELEEQYFEDDNLFEELLAVETGLVELHERGRLDASTARHLNSCLPPGEFRERVLFARALRQSIESVPRESVPRRRAWAWPSVAAAAAVLLAAVVPAWLAWRPAGPGEAAHHAPLAATPATPHPLATLPAPLALVLRPINRGEEPASPVQLPVPGDTLRLEFLLRDDVVYDRYAVTVQGLQFKQSRSFSGLVAQPRPAGGRELVVELSTAGLPADDYKADASGDPPDRNERFDGYTFRLSGKPGPAGSRPAGTH
jgi:hypothetical protein